MKKKSKSTEITLILIIGAIVITFIILIHSGPKEIILIHKQNQKIAEQLKDVDINGFTAQSIDGATVNSNIFKNYEITMIYIWSTSCGRCIEKIPEIAKLYRIKPAKSNIISICVDAGNNQGKLDFARKILRKSGAEFITLLPDDIIKSKITDHIHVFPTTIFVDNKGQIVSNHHFENQDTKKNK